jgi:hypothetical protein
MSPTNSRAMSHEHPLHLPPLSVSAQAGRQDPPLQHDSPPHRQRSSGDRLFAGPLPGRKPRKGGGSHRTAHASRWGRSPTRCRRLRMVARLPLPTPSSMGYFYSPSLQRGDRLLSRKRWDLIFVHCSSVAQYVEHVRDVPKILDFGDMDSQKWLEYATTSPSRCRSAIVWKATRCWRREAPGEALRPVYGDHARRMGDARRLSAPGRPPTGFRTVSTPSSSARRGNPTIRHAQLHRPHGLLPEPGVHGALLRPDLARC